MRNVDDLVKDGFQLPDRNGKADDTAFLSLRIALKAYFSTYQAMKYRLHLFEPGRHNQEAIDLSHSTAYCEACLETLIHFQHFFELICKQVLRAEHPLLSDLPDDAPTKPVILHKLLRGEQLSDDEKRGTKSIEAAEALRRLLLLIEAGRLSGPETAFWKPSKSVLEALNGLRNRQWHRGTYILRYPALDELVGGFLLPIVQDVVGLAQYTAMGNFWKHSPLACGSDPIGEIVLEWQTPAPRMGKVAWLKELGRAAYANPLPPRDVFESFMGSEIITRAVGAARALREEMHLAAINNCPVCGKDTLTVYDDVTLEGDVDGQGTFDKALRYTWQVECTCCTFSANHHLENPSMYGLALPEFWNVEEL